MQLRFWSIRSPLHGCQPDPRRAICSCQKASPICACDHGRPTAWIGLHHGARISPRLLRRKSKATSLSTAAFQPSANISTIRVSKPNRILISARSNFIAHPRLSAAQIVQIPNGAPDLCGPVRWPPTLGSSSEQPGAKTMRKCGGWLRTVYIAFRFSVAESGGVHFAEHWKRTLDGLRG